MWFIHEPLYLEHIHRTAIKFEYVLDYEKISNSGELEDPRLFLELRKLFIEKHEGSRLMKECILKSYQDFLAV